MYYNFDGNFLKPDRNINYPSLLFLDVNIFLVLFNTEPKKLKDKKAF